MIRLRQVALVAHDRVDRAQVADDRLDAAAEGLDDPGDFLELLGRETGGFGEDHGGTGDKCPKRGKPLMHTNRH